MKLSLKKGSSTGTGLKTLVVFTPAVEEKKTPVLSKYLMPLKPLLDLAIKEGAFSGKAKETLFLRSANLFDVSHVLVVGLGESKTLRPEEIRSAAAVAYGALKSHKVTSAGVDLASLAKPVRDVAKAVGAAAEGFWLGSYEFDDFKSKKDSTKSKPKVEEIVLLSDTLNKTMEAALRSATILAESTNFSRWLGDHPGNKMTPDRLARLTQEKAKGTGVKVTVWDRARIVKEKFGGLLSVSLGSSEEPRFIIMEYNGAAASKKPICFVGKGLTFDSGGISIKPSQNMDEMKYDMCGGANVIAAILAMARLKLKVNVIGLVPSTENMTGPSATKPGDIYTARNGKTVEVLNTDAEGRLILGDALAYASEQKPQAIFDAATLTGAIVVALGNSYTGVFSRDKKLVSRIQKCADVTGEAIWPMPLDDCHVEDMKGVHADLSNISNFKGAGSSTAAAFLEQFVEKEIPFAHFDIAGTAWNVSNRLTYVPKKGASGVMVRTFVELAKSYF